MPRLYIVLSALVSLLSSPAIACRAMPSIEEAERELRALINDADQVFIGQVERITRRRWSPDDEPGLFEKTWRSREADGREIPNYIRHLLDFPDATADLKVYLALQETGLKELLGGGSWIEGESLLAIDLLRPFTVAGHGPCHNFPRTCPWDVKPGEFVAVAVEERSFSPWLASFCVRIEHPTSDEYDTILAKRNHASADQMFWPYIEAAGVDRILKWEQMQ